MSIYVGGERAKLYRGDYRPAQLYKGGVKIAGYTDTEKVGVAISGVETYNDALKLTIEGRSEQTVTVQGKNLVDFLAYPRGGRDFKIAVSAGDYIQSTFNGNDLSTVGIIIGSTYASRFLDASGATVLWQIQSGVHVTEEQAKIITTLRVNWADAHYTGTSPTIVSQLEVGKIRTPYEPFVPNSPSPDYPSPIRSSENFDVMSCGRDPSIAITAHITAPLRSVGDVSDSIEVSEGKVEVVRRIDPTIDTCTTERIDVVGAMYVLATPTRTDITATPLGQALLAMRTFPNYTQVYTNATLPPTLRAKIKEMEL